MKWFDEFSSWLEYSKIDDATFCLYCYLFKPNVRDHGGGESFVVKGWDSWNKKESLRKHVGSVDSAHNLAYQKCQNLLNQNQSIETLVSKRANQDESNYRVRLRATVHNIHFLLGQGLSFRGHGESDDSINRRNFLELLKYTTDHNDTIDKVVLKNAPKNNKLTSPDIQKDVINAAAAATTTAIMKELRDSKFSVLIDESRDNSTKEQMAVILRFVSDKGSVVERFLAIEHVSDTTSMSLKTVIDQIFVKNNLSISQLRGQGYDRASNMQGELKGLKTLILNENKSAYYVHYFMHQLQLTLIAVVKKHTQVTYFFSTVSNASNVVGASCKRKDILRDIQAAKVNEALENNERTSWRGLNQETSFSRPGDTRWGSHYNTLLSIIEMYPSIIEVLDVVVVHSSNLDKKRQNN